jgi:putative component of toxin-antitoxin plasmid stabilization module
VVDEHVEIVRVVLDAERAVEWAGWLGSKQVRPFAKKVVAKVRLLPAHGIAWPGAVKRLSGNLYELRWDTGPGLRVYFRFEPPLARIVGWGDKSTQGRDVAAAQGET